MPTTRVGETSRESNNGRRPNNPKTTQSQDISCQDNIKTRFLVLSTPNQNRSSVEKYGIQQKYKQYGQVLDGPMVLGTRPKAYFEQNPFKDPDKFKPGPTYVPPIEKQIQPLPPGKFIPTGPAKQIGGCKAGCFDKFPQYASEKYRTAYDALYKPKKRTGGNFFPQSYADKTFYTNSVVNENVRFRVNEDNYKTYEPTFIKHLVD